jgi:general secretion pathway protein L
VTNIKALLNTDVSTLFRGVQWFWNWWTGELRMLLPPSLRGAAGKKNRLVAELKDNDLLFREYRRGLAVAMPRQGAAERLLPNAFFDLPPASVLVRDVSYPSLPLADLRRMTALDMDRLTPFRNEEVVFDLDVRPGQGAKKQVTVAIVRRKSLDDVLARLWSFGAEPLAIGLIDRHDGMPRFDFLGAAGGAGRRPLFGVKPVYWWLAAALLFAGNIGLLIAKDAYSVANLQNLVDVQRGSVVLASSLRRKVEQEARKRSVVINSLKRASPLAVLDAATKALPDSVSVRQLEWNGKRVHLIGTGPQTVDVSALLNATPLVRGISDVPEKPIHPAAHPNPPPVAAQPSPMAGPVPASAPTGPFDVTVNLKAAP